MFPKIKGAFKNTNISQIIHPEKHVTGDFKLQFDDEFLYVKFV